MTIAEYQQKVESWIHKYGVRYFDESTNMMLLMEEVGELSRLMARKFGEQSFKNPEHASTVDQQIADELSDIIFVLTCLSNQMQIDLTSSLERNFAKKTNRDGGRHLQNEKLNPH